MLEDSNQVGSPIKRAIAPPIFDDEDKTRTASLLNTILLGMLAILLLSTITIPYAEEMRMGVVPLGGMFVVGVIALIVMRLGFVNAAAILFSILMWGFYAILIFASGGVNGPMNSGPILLVVIAGLILGGRGAVVFAALGIATVVGVFSLETAGALPESMLGSSPIIGMATTIANIILA